MTNDMLRAHVTGTAFVLTLGKTHIAALVHLEEVLAWEEANGAASRRDMKLHRHPALGNFVPAASGLITRGLVTHHETDTPGVLRNDKAFVDMWQITKAGQLVLELLKECGIWQEYATNPAAAESRSAA